MRKHNGKTRTPCFEIVPIFEGGRYVGSAVLLEFGATGGAFHRPFMFDIRTSFETIVPPSRRVRCNVISRWRERIDVSFKSMEQP